MKKKPTTRSRQDRTIGVDFHDEATYGNVLGQGKAFIDLVVAFLLALGFQLMPPPQGSGGFALPRHSHYARVRLGGLTIWRLQCPMGKAVFTVLPHFVLRYRGLRAAVAKAALLATPGGLSLALCALSCHVSPLAISRVVCALGRRSMGSVLTRGGLPLPVYFLADEKHRPCLTDTVSLPTVVRGRVIWH
jgi:hypothetical protein